MSTFLVLVMTQTTNLSLGNEPTGVAIPSDPLDSFYSDGLQCWQSEEARLRSFSSNPVIIFAFWYVGA